MSGFKFSDKILALIVAVLIVIGLMLIFSAGSAFGMMRKNDFAYYFYRQAGTLIMAGIFFLIGLYVPYRFYKKISSYLLFLAVLTLFATLFANKVNGATRWIRFGGFGFQPAEVVKVLLIIHLAKIIVKRGDELKNIKKLFLPLGWMGAISVLLALQPNYSNAMLVGFIGIVMLYVGGAKKRQLLGIVFFAGLIALTAMWFSPHSHSRIVGWLGEADNNGIAAPNRQVMEALIGLGSGGPFGVGIGESQQANLFLPEAHTDFIFAVLGEELGFLGAVTVAVLYVLFFLSALITMNGTEDNYGKLLIFGLSFNIVLSATINIAVVLGLVPTTGITLPFVSFGGSSLVVFVYSIGVILNVNTNGEILFKTMNWLKERYDKTFKNLDNANV